MTRAELREHAGKVVTVSLDGRQLYATVALVPESDDVAIQWPQIGTSWQPLSHIALDQQAIEQMVYHPANERGGTEYISSNILLEQRGDEVTVVRTSRPR